MNHEKQNNERDEKPKKNKKTSKEPTGLRARKTNEPKTDEPTIEMLYSVRFLKNPVEGRILSI